MPSKVCAFFLPENLYTMIEAQIALALSCLAIIYASVVAARYGYRRGRVDGRAEAVEQFVASSDEIKFELKQASDRFLVAQEVVRRERAKYEREVDRDTSNKD